ncbi:hypothetical protein B0H12DRAFT_507490 [Mycena haematopus]|nr:hypothetical protein B0H12DRAFT_507490 [Mycena haematopus]
MCHRQLFFTKALRCGHSTYSSEIMVDCQSRYCRLSSAHPRNCPRCTCRRYYGQPERLVSAEVRVAHSCSFLVNSTPRFRDIALNAHDNDYCNHTLRHADTNLSPTLYFYPYI